MFSVQDLIDNKDAICKLSKMLGFVNLRVFKGVTDDNEYTLNILADLDLQNNDASFVRVPLLAAELERIYCCMVSVTLAAHVIDFYKMDIIAKCVPLDGDSLVIAKIYTRSDFQDFNFAPTIRPYDELEDDTFRIYHEVALQIISAYEATEQVMAEDVPTAKKLQEKDGFSLLLLTVTPFDNSGPRNFIVCVDDARAANILAKTQLTVLDYERCDIVRAFGEDEAVSEEDIKLAIAHFEQHSVTNAKMRNKFQNLTLA
jgi:hypothetical protein